MPSNRTKFCIGTNPITQGGCRNTVWRGRNPWGYVQDYCSQCRKESALRIEAGEKSIAEIEELIESYKEAYRKDKRKKKSRRLSAMYSNYLEERKEREGIS